MHSLHTVPYGKISTIGKCYILYVGCEDQGIFPLIKSQIAGDIFDKELTIDGEVIKSSRCTKFYNIVNFCNYHSAS